DVSPTDIIGKCLELGMIATMNQRLEFDTSSLISEEYGFKALLLEEKINEIKEEKEEEIDESLLKPRAPVVTIMGHVDHGKTSLLDYIRNENVVAGEAGGITQHIGAYEVHLNNDPTKSVTFLDTPGHQAFTAMRARGAQVTDVVILIVAADDGVKPQTIEAIDHAKAANVPIVVAINKIDKKNINTDLVKKELSEHGVLVEDWGGKVQCMPVSAKNGIGIDELLELLALETEVLELKANPDSFAVATVVESRLDKGHGAIATVLIQRGTLEVGNVFICGNFNGKVRALMNERNKRVDKAGPSQPVQVLGFQSVPQAGDVLKVVSDEKTAKRISIERDRVQREINRQKIHTMSLDKISADIRDGASKVLPLLVKSDVDGSMEALIGAISDIPSDEVKVDIVHKSVGIITESDVLLAAASNAVIIGFNINMNANASLVAKKNGVEVRIYNVIYDAINEIKLALEGLLEPDIIEKITGKAEVLQVFKITKLGIIAGSKVLDGKILSSDMVKVLRKDEKIYTGKISSLKHFQEDVKEVDSGKECGIGLEKMKNFEPGDIIESYTTEEIKRTLSK
ncbi:MAG: translation initiation factor IF-2, partial [Candidatus Marinimicrobia bacterium]|nr:translation initiation factor IF-2 [Candidatus Neomarinimicrobiota bacterium]